MNQEIVISHSKTKRKIDGAFEMCGDRETLLFIGRQILRQVERETFAYGWVEIVYRTPSLTNTKPVGWDE